MCERLKQAVLKVSCFNHASLNSTSYSWIRGRELALSGANWRKCSTLCSTLVMAIMIGCGGGGMQVIPTVHAAPPPTGPQFPPAQPLTCTGTLQDVGGMVCLFSDGAHLYQLSHTQINIRPDGHGTFLVATETGINNPANPTDHQIIIDLPQTINIVEVHSTLNIVSWCAGNGIETNWQGLNGSTVEQLIDDKTERLNAGEVVDPPIPQVVFPVPVPAKALMQNTFNDLCAVSTISWTLNGSF
jgi:hypothetical protein